MNASWPITDMDVMVVQWIVVIVSEERCINNSTINHLLSSKNRGPPAGCRV
jgi:hypothetical protein